MKLILFAPLFVLLAACGPGYDFEQTHQLPEWGWSYSDTINFDFQVSDTTQLYKLHLLIDHGDDFASQNTYVRVKMRLPDGQRTDAQLSLQLADELGNWLGNCSGSDCRLDIPIQQNAYFSQAGDYQLTVEQYSRQDTLTGLQAVTFALEPVH